MNSGLVTTITPTECISPTIPLPYTATDPHRDCPTPQLPHTATPLHCNSPTPQHQEMKLSRFFSKSESSLYWYFYRPMKQRLSRWKNGKPANFGSICRIEFTFLCVNQIKVSVRHVVPTDCKWKTRTLLAPKYGVCIHFLQCISWHIPNSY